MSPSPRSRNSASHRHVTSAVWRTTALSFVLLATADAGVADDLLSGLAKPHEGRSMRATSTFRQGKDGKYDPKAEPEGRPRGGHQLRQLPRGAGRDARADGRQGARRHHAHLDHVPRARAAGLGEEGLGQPPGDAAAHLLGRAGTARRRGAGGRFLRQLLRQAQRGHQPAGRSSRTPTPTTASGGCRSASRPGSRSSTRARSRSACSTTTSTGSRRTRCPRTRPTSTPSTARNIRSQQGQGLRAARDQGQGPLRGHGAGRAHPQPGLVRRGRREDLHRRRGEALDLGHGHGGLFPLGLGAEDDRARPTSACPTSTSGASSAATPAPTAGTSTIRSSSTRASR